MRYPSAAPTGTASTANSLGQYPCAHTRPFRHTRSRGPSPPNQETRSSWAGIRTRSGYHRHNAHGGPPRRRRETGWQLGLQPGVLPHHGHPCPAANRRPSTNAVTAERQPRHQRRPRATEYRTRSAVKDVARTQPCSRPQRAASALMLRCAESEEVSSRRSPTTTHCHECVNVRRRKSGRGVVVVVVVVGNTYPAPPARTPTA
jgi:hypothetical protein